jgi:hypothetical protein
MKHGNLNEDDKLYSANPFPGLAGSNQQFWGAENTTTYSDNS